jgi:AcrR family transcriptional regulator
MAPRRAAAVRSPGTDPVSLRDHLVVTTDALLADVPLGTLTTRQIARQAGVSDGVLYNHFPDKGSLLMAALLHRYQRLIEQFEVAAPPAGRGSVASGLTAFAHALADLDADALQLGAGLLANPLLLERFWAEIHRRPFGIGRLRRPLLAYLRAERAAGRVDRSADLEAIVTLVFGACGVVALGRRVNPLADRAEFDAQLDAAIATIVSGIAPPPSA